MKFNIYLCLIAIIFSNLLSAQQIESNKDILELVINKNDIVNEIIKLKNIGDSDLSWKAYIKCETVFFEKKDSTDWSLPENQDRINDFVALTRANRRSFFNAKREVEHKPNGSPKGTMWALGKTVDMAPPRYTHFRKAFKNPLRILDTTVSLRLNRDQRYFDLILKSFGGKNGGGGFSYSRNEINPKWITLNYEYGKLAPGKKIKMEIEIDSNHEQFKEQSLSLIIATDDNIDLEIPINIKLMDK